ncbi:hypothetical protein BDZ90DRAFT_262587 [Jaminaea rosea]|uniref:Uncharacterized protein n=1 Tax=Jaminaea rosea TaxID=1569628 RepID=A0A316UK12_9BASI|nr:hypothetical protein BDZ90DRAFT_262587 [Jaminaea rosea]PWN25138.1 hypothetical protein BDZ90DRAFT_262587 [Jaminaea rosea]
MADTTSTSTPTQARSKMRPTAVAGPHDHMAEPRIFRDERKQSLRLDLEGLDLGGPSTLFDVAAAQQAASSSSSSDRKAASPRIKSIGRSPLRTRRSPSKAATTEDTFVAHLRSNCLAANEILPSEVMLDPKSLSPPSQLDHHFNTTSMWDRPAAASPHQVLGGFASLGPTSWTNSQPFLPPSMRSSLECDTCCQQAASSSVGSTLEPRPHDAMHVLDLMSVDEMGTHSINVGNRDDWQGALLAPSASSPLSPEEASTAWMSARSTQAKRKWIVAPLLADDETAASRTIVVSDKAAMSRIQYAFSSSSAASTSNHKPPAAFSGLAHFELRSLREGLSKPGVVLANPSTLRVLYSTDLGSRRASSRRVESLSSSRLSVDHPSPASTLRRTRSRPALKYGALDHYDELSNREQQLVQSLVSSGLIDAGTIGTSSGEAINRRRASLDEPRRSMEDYDKGQGGASLDTIMAASKNTAQPQPVSPLSPISPTAPLPAPTAMAQSRTWNEQEQEVEQQRQRQGAEQRDLLRPRAATTSLDPFPSSRQQRRTATSGGKLGEWLKRKISGHVGASSSSPSSASSPFASPQLPYGRRGSASDEELVLNAGKAQRRQGLGLGIMPQQSMKAMRVKAPAPTSMGLWLPPAVPPPAFPKVSAVSSPPLASPMRTPTALLGLNDVSEDALTMLIPLGSDADRRRRAPRRYLRVTFVPFSGQDNVQAQPHRHRHHRHQTSYLPPNKGRSMEERRTTITPGNASRDTFESSPASPTMTTSTSNSSSASAVSSTSSSAVGGVAVAAAQAATGWLQRRRVKTSGAEREQAQQQLERDEMNITSLPIFTSTLLSPTSTLAPLTSLEGEGASSSNRRASHVEAFRVTALVVGDNSVGPSSSSLLPEPGTFPVVLAVCLAGKSSLDLVAEGWDSLGLETSGSSGDEKSPMFRVADTILAACAAVMDL